MYRGPRPAHRPLRPRLNGRVYLWGRTRRGVRCTFGTCGFWFSHATGSRCSTSTESSTAIPRSTSGSLRSGSRRRRSWRRRSPGSRSTGAWCRSFPARTRPPALRSRVETRWRGAPTLTSTTSESGRSKAARSRTTARGKRAHARQDPFPGGESLDDAARRYAGAYQRLLEADADTILCVCHEIPVRYAVNAATGSDDLDAPVHDVANATPYVFDADGLKRAVDRLRR